ncbi:Cytochrome P450 3A11 [Araneus ventricosus]|uniref:Cytochrome P450 3A11 n=1 Tax=Araneus ventricosus TaxID=182803 RepID=A0A4Y2KIN4_ARAVE|nr:Cytochrome P450 3A11 [Araneus ventricosus]
MFLFNRHEALLGYSTQNFDYWKKRGIPHAGPAIPFVGTLYPLLWKPSHEIDLERYLKLGPVYGQYDGNTPVLAVADPKLLREILVKEFPTFMNRRMAGFMSGDAMVSSFLFTLRGEEWRRMRNIISPTFSTGKIKKMINYIKQCSSTMIENLKKASKFGKPLQVKQFSNAFSMDVIASAAFSVHLDSYNDPKNTFIQSALKAFSPYINFKLAFYQLWPKLAKRVGVQVIYTKPLYFFKESALHIMKQRKKTGHTRNDFLQFLMRAVKDFAEEKEGDVGNDEKDMKSHEGQDKSNNQINKSLSLDEAVSQSVQFFVAGFDTVSSAIANAVYLLALHPDIQNRAYEEVRDVLLKTEGDLTYEALQEMNYLDNVISETLRLYPSFPRLERVTEADYKLGSTGVVMPKGTTLVIPVYAMQRDPKLYPDPNRFDPDRFLSEERAKRDPYSYMPFGTGPRVCIGMRFGLMQVKTCLTYIIANFRIHRCPETKVPLEFRLGPGPLASKSQILRFEERTDKIPLK